MQPNFNDLMQQGLEQWSLLIADVRSTAQEIAEIFEELVLDDDDD